MYSYTSANPIAATDSFGLAELRDEIAVNRDSDVNAWLGRCSRYRAGGECSLVRAFVDGECKGEGGCWRVEGLALVLQGDINLYVGDFRNLPLGARPDDPNITNSTQAFDHAYRVHIRPAAKKALGVLERLEKMTFSTKEVCGDFFLKYSNDALQAFLDEMRNSENWERRGKRR